MTTQNTVPSYGRPAILRPAPLVWLPALLGIAVICGESTNAMGANHTSVWLNQLSAALGHPNGPVALLNHLLRKTGHFTGYGILGLCFARGWRSWLRRRVSATWNELHVRAGALGIASAFAVASADEIHQIFLPTRGASAWDVLLDTSGAVTLNLIFFGFLALRRNALLNPSTPLTTLGLSFTGLPLRLSYSRGEFRAVSRKSKRRTKLARLRVSLLSQGTSSH